MNDRERKLKLLEDEVVHAETFELAAKVCELADKLGLTWCNNISYLSNLNWDRYTDKTCYDLHISEYADLIFNRPEGKTIITATEWLNRHGIFIFGQDVLLGPEKEPRIYVARKNYVVDYHRTNFHEGKNFNTLSWDSIHTPFPEWNDEPEQVTLILDGEEIMISKESANALKQKFGCEK